MRNVCSRLDDEVLEELLELLLPDVLPVAAAAFAFCAITGAVILGV